MKNYCELLAKVLSDGNTRTDRTGTGTISLFGPQLEFDLQKGFPAVTTKRLFFRGVVHELLWFLKGEDNISYLQDNNIHIWDEWADEKGNVGPIYGWNWRKWKSQSDEGRIDQIKQVILSITNNPTSRRHIVSAWNVSQIDQMALPPCHLLFQFYVHGNKLSCKCLMRSCDLFLGSPFNIASYALLTHMIAQVCDLKVGRLIMTFGDAHIYLNHLDQVKLQLTRAPMSLPTLRLNPDIKDIDDFKFEDIKLVDYKSHKTIKGEISI